MFLDEETNYYSLSSNVIMIWMKMIKNKMTEKIVRITWHFHGFMKKLATFSIPEDVLYNVNLLSYISKIRQV
jgi:hypothetical protein